MVSSKILTGEWSVMEKYGKDGSIGKDEKEKLIKEELDETEKKAGASAAKASMTKADKAVIIDLNALENESGKKWSSVVNVDPNAKTDDVEKKPKKKVVKKRHSGLKDASKAEESDDDDDDETPESTN